MFVTGLLGVGGLSSGLGQFSGINNYQPQRPFLFGQQNHQPSHGFGSFGDGISSGYYKSDLKTLDSIQFQDVVAGTQSTTASEKEPSHYADQFYNYENKATISKPENKEPKNPGNRSARANSYRNFVWQSN